MYLRVLGSPAILGGSKPAAGCVIHRTPAPGWQCLFGALRGRGTSTGGEMHAGFMRAMLAAAALVLGAASAFAQQATITGTVTDTSGGVLPGVTVIIVHDETGNTFEAVTD